MVASVHNLSSSRDLTTRLEESGWRSKTRLGKTIWQHPGTGFWLSEEMALRISEKARYEGNGEE